jgi:hypothetical protein
MVTCAECNKVLMAEMAQYFTANRRFHFCDAYCSTHWHMKHETNGDLKRFPDEEEI